MSINFNDSWEFLNGDKWEAVTIPHTPKIEERNVGANLQGIFYYRKKFIPDDAFKDKIVLLEFGAIMHKSEIKLNGKVINRHEGGYLPIVIDISRDVVLNEENLLEVTADNTDDPDIPPGKPLTKLDFCYFGGIYRNVYLHLKNKVYITNPLLENIEAGGGIFVTYENVSEKSAQVNIKVNIKNEYTADKNVTLSISADNRNVTQDVFIGAGGCCDAKAVLNIENPRLWSPDNPNLYKLDVEILDSGRVLDSNSLKIGIREISVDCEKGFILNGKRIMLRGANRHQQYPHVGNAVSDEAHKREALQLKNAGFNFLRLGHYPQAEAFLDACDELGIILVEPTPGWQWCKEGRFKDNVRRNVREMIRRDRNHPSVMLWELSLNETGDNGESQFDMWSGATDDFYAEIKEIAKSEYPTNQFICSGDTFGRNDPKKVGYDIAYSCFDAAEMCRTMPLSNTPGLDREYGDFEFGGNYSTTRQTRGGGEYAMLLSAWNFIWSHNKNRGHSWCVGDAIWVANDYSRGYFPEVPLCTCGITDVMRKEKMSYYFFRSQQSKTPVVHIANYWQNEGQKTKKVVVFSNCDEVILKLNGREIAKQGKDWGPDSEYNVNHVYADPNYWLNQSEIQQAQNKKDDTINAKNAYEDNRMFDGGNCRSLENPPFTFFNMPFEEGTLEAIGIKDGKEAASHKVSTYKEPRSLRLTKADWGIDLVRNGNDFIFVNCDILDENSNVVFTAENVIKFSAVNGEIIGDSTITAEGGCAVVMVKSASDNMILKAECEGLESAEIRI